ncbi:MAG TPA: hypothetical protein VGE94_01965, partial [Chloroflexota bacterium]
MIRSDSRIRVTHQGTLPRPAELEALVRRAVADVVQKQLDLGLDSINDGEMSKSSFSDYVAQRLGGIEKTAEPYYSPITGRDRQDFPEYFASRMLGGGYRRIFQCTAPLTYVGMQDVLTDIANLEAAMAGKNVEQAWPTAGRSTRPSAW